MIKEFGIKVVYQGRLKRGEDILQGMTEVMKARGLTGGIISGIGAVSQAHIGYYNAAARVYEEKMLRENLEIVSLKGNISLKDGQPFPHLHIVLSGADYSTVGGHLFGDTLVFAFEYEIIVFEGDPFVRTFDEDTGLFLWSI